MSSFIFFVCTKIFALPANKIASDFEVELPLWFTSTHEQFVIIRVASRGFLIASCLEGQKFPALRFGSFLRTVSQLQHVLKTAIEGEGLSAGNGNCFESQL